MSHDLSLAQNHAYQLAHILMAPVTLFRSDDGYCVLPSSELGSGTRLEDVFLRLTGGDR